MLFALRRLLRGALPVLLLLLLASDALAFGRRGCSNCSSAAQPRGGLLAGIRDRAQERRDARAGERQQPPGVAFRPAAAVAYPAVSYGGGGCPGGVCPIPGR